MDFLKRAHEGAANLIAANPKVALWLIAGLLVAAAV